MKKVMKRILVLLTAVAVMAALAGCGEAPADTAPQSAEKVFNIGVCQLAQHPALDAATEGFIAGVEESLGSAAVVDVKNASGDSPTCSVICNQFVSDEVDLIMANATPAFQAAVSATNEIPVLGTSVTDYGTALGDESFDGTSGKNICGTSDLAPLNGQAQILAELLPEAKTVGLLFCSGEPNSRFQVDTITPIFEGMGLTVKEFSFSDSNDVSAVCENACSECDVLYVPTDNTAASCGEAINNVALNAKVPVVCGEENCCRTFGVATLSISYFDLGFETGKMAGEILKGEADISQMAVRFAPSFTKIFNPEICEALGISVPEDFVAVSEQ